MGKQSRKRRDKFQRMQTERERRGLVKEARFFDQIRAMVKQNPDYNFVSGESVVVDITDIRNAENSDDYISIKDWSKHLIAPIKPPFEKMFIEFVDVPELPVTYRCGVYVFDTGNGMEMFGFGKFDDFEEAELIPDVYVVAYEKDGYFKNAYSYETSAMTLDELPRSAPVGYDDVFFTVLQALQLLNCRNIELVDHEPDPGTNRQYQHHFGQPMTKYKTLRVKPTGKRDEAATETKDYQGLMPLHLRRGNFATYTEDAPLFGKYVGTFWRPATAVGETKNGVVVKDYEVVP
jgi:hypothetical protein